MVHAHQARPWRVGTLHKPVRNVVQTDTGVPVEVLTEGDVCLLPATMPARRCIVILKHDLQSLIMILRDDDREVVVSEGSVPQKPIVDLVPVQR